MRVAMCVSGLPRFSKSTTQLIKDIEEQFKNCHVDWFFYLWNISDGDPFVHSSWTNIEVASVEQRIKSRLPTDHFLAGIDIGVFQGEFFDPSLMLRPNGAPTFLAQYRVDQLRRNLELKENFLYDIVVRLRPDVTVDGIMPKIIPKNYTLVVYTETWFDHPYKQPSAVSDVFAAGGSNEMTRYSNLIGLYQSYKPFFLDPPTANECILACHLFLNGITPYVDPNFTVHLRQSNRVDSTGKLYYEPDYTDWED